MTNLGLTFTTAILLVFAGTQARAASIVVNGGFETGDFTGWTANSASDHPWLVVTSGFRGESPYAGTFFAATGCLGAACITGSNSDQSSLSQTLTTVVGDGYTLDFEFYTGGYGSPSELQVLFGGVVVEDILNTAISAYQEIAITGLVATSTSTTLTFLGRQDPGYNGLDNVSVVDTGNATPEPASWMLALIGSSALFGSRLRGRA